MSDAPETLSGTAPDPAGGSPARVNAEVWASGSYFKQYATRELWPVEVLLLIHYREGLAGRTLELGCGAGRLTGYLVAIGRDVHGIDIAPRMVDHCRKTLPGGTFHEGDLTDLSMFADASFDAIVAPANVLDVLDDTGRRTTLASMHRLLVDGGLLIMSSHNRGHVSRLRTPTEVRWRDPLRGVNDVLRLPQRAARHRRLGRLERDEPGYAIINDSAHGYTLLHYFISRDEQQRQFSEHGFSMLDCLDAEGRPVNPGETASDYVELHYVARQTDPPGGRIGELPLSN